MIDTTQEDRLNDLYRQVVSDFLYLGYEVPTHKTNIKWEYRLKNSLGQCRSTKFSRTGEFIHHRITLNTRLQQFSDDIVKDTIAHECIHTICPRDKHGCTFQYIMNRLNILFGYHIEVKNTKEEVQKAKSYKWEVYCPHCNKVIGKRHRRPSCDMVHKACKNTVIFRGIK